MKNLLVIICLLILLCLSACCPPPVAVNTNIITQFYAPTEPGFDISPTQSQPALPPLQANGDITT